MVLTAPRPIRADTPGEAIPTPKGFFDNFTLGVKSGWQETTLNLLRDQSILQNAQYQKNAGIPQTEWNEANPLYVEGLEWFEGLNYEMVRRAHETLELSKQMQTAKDNSTGFDYAGQFVGMLGSAFLDPINYIPLPIARFGKSLLTKATMVGGVNAGIEASLFPVMKDAYRTRGREFGFEEAAVNAMFAFGAGATLYGGFAGLAKGMRAMNLGPAPKTIADNLITQRRNQHPEYDIEQTIGDLLNKNIVTLRNNGFDNIRDFKFNAKSIENFYVDTSGKIFRNLDDGANITTTKDFIEVVTDTTGTIILRGPSKALTKILPTISRNSSSDVKFRIEDTDAQRTLEANREQINEFAKQEAKALNKTTITSSEKVFNKLFNIDNTKSLTTLDDLDDLFVIKGTEYEIEPDAVRGINFDENIGRIIRNQNGKRTVITDQTERKAVIESLRKQLTDEGLNPGTDTVRTNQIESYETKVDNNLQPNREADTQETMRVVSRIDETNEVDAGRTPEELESVKTATATRSQAVETITQTYTADQLRTYGLEIRKDDTWKPLLQEIKNFFGAAKKRDFDDFSLNSIDNIIAELPFSRQDLKLKIENGRYVKSGEIDTGSKQFVFQALKGQADQNILKKSFQDIILRGQNKWLNADDLVDVGDIDEIYTRAITEGGYGRSREEMLASKARLKILFDRLKNKETIETATKEYNICRRS